MGTYMIDINLPQVFEPDFMSLIPYQRAFIQKMLKKGVIVSYALSMDRKKLWVTANADSINEVKNLLGSFPIFNYIKFTIHDLLFHEIGQPNVPQFWLN